MVVNFLCRESKKGKNGLSPVEMSVIINGQRKIITLDLRVKASSWKSQSQKSSQKTVNDYLSAVRTKMYSIETELIKRGKSVAVDLVIDIFKNGFKEDEKGVLEYFDEYNREKGKAVNTTYITIMKYIKVRDYLNSFIFEAYGVKDMPLTKINNGFCQKFYDYLLRFNANNSVVGKMKQFKTVLGAAVNDGILDKNPMTLKFHLDKVLKKPLTKAEIKKIEEYVSPVERVMRVKDCFLFQCYTALSYADMAEVTKEDILDSEYGKYIQKERIKTKVTYTSLLNEKAMAILEKYDYKLPVLSNQKYNTYLHELEVVVGINKPLTSHLARHTAATILLNDGVPISVVSKVLGHTNTRMTEHYAKTLDSTILREMRKVQ